MFGEKKFIKSFHSDKTEEQKEKIANNLKRVRALAEDGEPNNGDGLVRDLAETEGSFREKLKAEGNNEESRNRLADFFSDEALGRLEDDIAKKRAEEERDKARAESNVDPLTGLYNRRYFHNEALKLLELERSENEDSRRKHYSGEEHRKLQQCAVIFMDLDGFKAINDTHGHRAGDKILQMVAGIIRDMVRHYDVPCRHGGDEFMIFIPKADEAGARQVAEHIMNAIKSEIFPVQNNYGDTKSLNIGASIGYTSTEQIPEWKDASIRFSESEILDLLEKQADTAMYVSKGKGKNQISSWSSEMEKPKKVDI